MHGEASSYDGMQVILRRVADLRNLSRQTIDEKAGLATGYAAKVLAEIPLRRMGPDTIGPISEILGIKWVAVDDPEALAKYTDRAPKREIKAPRLTDDKHKIIIVRVTRHRMKKLAKLAAAARLVKIPAERRVAIARHAANVMWERRRRFRAALPKLKAPV